MSLPITSGILPIHEGTGFLFACSLTRLLYSAFWLVKSMKASACAGLLGFGSFNKSCTQNVINMGANNGYTNALHTFPCSQFAVTARHTQSSICTPEEHAQTTSQAALL